MSGNQQQQQGQTQSGYNHKAEDGSFNISPVDTYDPSTGVGQAGVAQNVNLKPTGSGYNHQAVDGDFNISPVDAYNPQTGQNVPISGRNQGGQSQSAGQGQGGGLQYGGEIQDQLSSGQQQQR